jgi:hypothetical protein
MFCLLTLPFQLFFGLLLLPFLLIKWTIKLLLGLALLPFVLLFAGIVVVLTFLAVLTAVIVPLIPFALAIGFIWFLVRLASPRHSFTRL